MKAMILTGFGFLSLLGLYSTAVAERPGYVGNGGEVVVIQETKMYYELVELAASKKEFKLTGLSVYSEIESRVELLRTKHSEALADFFDDQFKLETFYFVDYSLNPSQPVDPKLVDLTKYLAVRYKNEVFINKKIFDASTNQTKLFVFFHEALHAMLTNIEDVRGMVRLIASDFLEEMEKETFLTRAASFNAPLWAYEKNSKLSMGLYKSIYRNTSLSQVPVGMQLLGAALAILLDEPINLHTNLKSKQMTSDSSLIITGRKLSEMEIPDGSWCLEAGEKCYYVLRGLKEHLSSGASQHFPLGSIPYETMKRAAQKIKN